ncbi:MAG: glucose-1-phosphate adenylyltransferase [Clostridiales bacterium]|jgi:glucose-1-phosphate adenylyltransferase|nr:glucose-1-phosphate adenylyltransferase [Clostridiales bacterium]
MRTKECVAMLLAGGQGSRLGVLTKNLAKPAVPYGGKYRIIDFPLSNCTNSGIDTVGVLTQYRPLRLNTYIGIGEPWDLDRVNGGVTILPPYSKQKSGEWYSGTANAIYQNIEYIDSYHPEYILILSGDHVYKMDYSRMLRFHKENKAGCTIATIEVPWEEASRFGIMNADENCRIYKFQEKPQEPISNKASMGIYIFNWALLRHYLIEDQNVVGSSNDFGKNIIPNMLEQQESVYAYTFNGYWKDVGTIESLWEANMDLLEDPPKLDLYDPGWRIYGKNPVEPPHYVAAGAVVKGSIITEGAIIYGNIDHSVLFSGVYVGKGSRIKDSIIMPNARIGSNTVIENSIIGEDVIIGDNCHIGDVLPKGSPASMISGLSVVGESVNIPSGSVIGSNAMVDMEYVRKHLKKRSDLMRKEEVI